MHGMERTGRAGNPKLRKDVEVSTRTRKTRGPYFRMRSRARGRAVVVSQSETQSVTERD